MDRLFGGEVEIKVFENPDCQITQDVLCFQFGFMEWKPDSMQEQTDRYGTLPFSYAVTHHQGRIAGVINLLKRKIRFQSEELLLGGFGGVCTHKDFRRQGIATALLARGMEVLRAENCDIAYLCTDIDELASLYAQVGFVPLGRPYLATGASGKIYRGDNGMIAPVCSEQLFDLVLQATEDFDLQGQDW